MGSSEITSLEEKLFFGVKKVLTDSKGSLTCKNEKSINKVIKKVVKRLDKSERLLLHEQHDKVMA